MKTLKDLSILAILMIAVLAFSYFMAVVFSKKPVTNTAGMNFIKIKSGYFQMGSPENEEGRYNRETQHWVTITKDFYIQTTEVTQAQWTTVMGTKPWEGKTNVRSGDNFPATFVSWNDCKEFIKKLNELEKTDKYRLPTEAEWEYACKGGSKGAYGFLGTAQDLDKYAWFNENTVKINENFPHETGLKRPNKNGLYDMHGNVWEWCEDWYTEDLGKDDAKDPKGPSEGKGKVFKGGGYVFSARDCRSANRYFNMNVFKDFVLGFRLVMSEESKPKED